MIGIGVKPNEIPPLMERLEKEVYDCIPESKCLGCPVNGGKGQAVTAECCRKASPALFLIEFLNIYDHVQKTWSNEDRKKLIYSAFEDILDSTNVYKPCLLLDKETNLCKAYKQRWANCRTYGMISDGDWRTRAIAWVKEKLGDKIVKIEKKTVQVESGLIGHDNNPIMNEREIDVSTPDTEAIDKYVKQLFKGKKLNVNAVNEKVEKDYGLQNVIYEQCRNVEMKSINLDLDSSYIKLAEIESKLVGYDITTDAENQTYMQFHVYLLFFILGEQKVAALVQGRETWTDEQKQHFLGLIKQQVDALSSIQLF